MFRFYVMVGHSPFQPTTATRATIQTLETIKAGEKIIEAIEIAERELTLLREYQQALKVCSLCLSLSLSFSHLSLSPSFLERILKR
jgi:hypothetical protein